MIHVMIESLTVVAIFVTGYAVMIPLCLWIENRPWWNNHTN